MDVFIAGTEFGVAFLLFHFIDMNDKLLFDNGLS